MKYLRFILVITLGFAAQFCLANDNEQGKVVKTADRLKIVFADKEYTFKQDEIKVIEQIILKATQEVRTLMPSLQEHITAEVHTTGRNLDMVGGVYGRAEAPGLVRFFLSTATKGGVKVSAQTALRSSAYHELHHLAIGWTIKDNKFGEPAGIPIASVNEGLASVFSETYTDQYFPLANDYPNNVHQWFDEVMKLPIDANYGHWVAGFHPDGRSVIGYRLGRYIIHQAQKRTGKSVIELSKMDPNAVLDLLSK